MMGVVENAVLAGVRSEHDSFALKQIRLEVGGMHQGVDTKNMSQIDGHSDEGVDATLIEVCRALQERV